uniref:Uncharacterized protein n=1 Tax=Heterorhabditis bacteriophora TaxID=37862 RepID=A0A1I7XBZ4_HETBA
MSSKSPDSEIEILNNTSPKQLPNPLLPTKPFSMESKSHFNPEMYSRLLASQTIIHNGEQMTFNNRYNYPFHESLERCILSYSLTEF